MLGAKRIDFLLPFKVWGPNHALTPQTMGGGGAVRLHPLSFCPLLKIIMRHPYLKSLDLAKLFVADAPMKKKSRNLVLPPLRAL